MKFLTILFFFLIITSPYSHASLDDEEGALNRTAKVVAVNTTKATFYTVMSKSSEWLIRYALVDTLDNIGKSIASYKKFALVPEILGSMIGLSGRGAWFLKNRKAVEQYGSYIGAGLGTLVAIGITEYLLPAGEYVSKCWIKCAKSVWDWDSKKSNKRDKIITGSSIVSGIALWYYRSPIMIFLFGPKWQSYFWK